MSAIKTKKPTKKEGGNTFGFKRNQTPSRTALIYLIFGVLWILLTDRVVSFFLPTIPSTALAQTLKGLLFVGTSALLVYIVLQRDMRALAESEQRYKLLFESNPQPMWVYDLETLAFLMVNDAAVNDYGYSREEFLRMTIKDIRPVEDMPVLMSNVAQETRPLQKSYGWRHRKKDGTLIDVEVTSHVMQFDGRPARLVLANDVTERKQAENAIKISEENYRSLAETSDTAIAVLDYDGRLRYANPASLHVWNDPHLVGKTVFDLFPEESARQYLTVIRRVIDEKSIDLSEFEENIKGRPMWFRISLSPLKNADGSVTTLQLNAHDITASKQMERSLRESEARFRTLVEQMPAITYTAALDEVSTTLYISPQIKQYMDLSGEKGKSWLDYLHPEDRLRVLAELAQSHKSGEPFETEYRVITPDGRLIWFRDTARQVLDKDGQPVCLQGLMFDITERKQSEEALQTSEAKYRSLIESWDNSIGLMDRDGRYLYINEVGAQWYGKTPQEMIGKSLHELFPEYYQEPMTPIVREVFEHNRGVVREVPSRTRDGQWFRISVQPVRDAHGNVTHATINSMNITERKQSEEALRSRERILRLFVEHSPAAIAMFDREMKYIIASRRYLADYRLGEQDLTGRSHYEVFPEVPDRWKEIHQRCLTGVIEKADEEPFPRADGRLDWERWEIHPWYQDDGEVGGLILFSEIITERVQAKEEIEILSRFPAENPNPVLRCDLEGRLLYANPASAPILELWNCQVGDLLPEEWYGYITSSFASGYQLHRELQCGGQIFTARITPIPNKRYVNIYAVDITERKQAELALLASEERYRQTLDSMMEGCQILDFNWRYIYINDAAAQQGRSTREELLGRTILEMYPGIEYSQTFSILRDTMEKRITRQVENEFTYPDGSTGWFELTVQPAPEGIVVLSFDITERKRAEKALRESEQHYHLLFEDSPISLWEEDFSEVKKHLDALRKQGVVDFLEYFEDHPEAVAKCAQKIVVLDLNKAALKMYGATDKEELVKITIDNLVNGGFSHLAEELNAVAEGRTYFNWEGNDVTLTGEPIDIHLSWVVVPGHEHDFSKVIVTTIDITERKRAEREIHQRTAELLLINALNEAANSGEDIETIVETFTREARDMFNCQDAAVYLLTPDGQYLEMQSTTVPKRMIEQIEKYIGITVPRIRIPVRPGSYTAQMLSRPQGHFTSDPAEIQKWIAEFTETAFLPNVLRSAIKKFIPQIHKMLGINSTVMVPLVSSGRTIGLLDMSTRGEFSPEDMQRIRILSHQMTAVILRRQAEANGKTQIKRITALNEIDRAISSSFDMRLSLDVLLQEVTSQLNVDAASVLLLNSVDQSFEFIAGRGFRTPAVRRSRLRFGEGMPGQVGLERKVVHIPNLHESGHNFIRAELLKSEEFIEYFGVPLIAKGSLKGVMEIFNRTPLTPAPDRLHYLETLGGQAAIAIDNAQLFEDIQQSNQELIIAYDATIEGWSRAMDLRDEETEGHTRRVTDLTLKLAERMGISEQERIHMRRGALLHDIGKLGVPDNILLKPGKLTDEEWVVMRKHPTHAFEMLMPIKYLRPALDIPHSHHEKWDGSGYPRGLQGREIPLAARIFAVVDVWDALRSDRPYREGWPAERVRKYIQEQSGKHFDPEVVEVFMKLLDEYPDLY